MLSLCFINVIIIADDNLLPSKDVQYFCDIVLFIGIVHKIKCSTCMLMCIAIYTVVLVVLFTSSLDGFPNKRIHFKSNHQRSDNNLNHTH